MPHRVAVLALDRVVPLDLAIPTQVFRARPETPYEVTVCAQTSRVTTSSGFEVAVDSGLDELRAADTVVVPGSEPVLRSCPGVVAETLLDARDRGARIVSICTGTFALASAGLLDGLRVTTHWQYIDDLERDFPTIKVERDVLYVDEGDVLTSAGVCCGIDLCLHIVRRDLGAAKANMIARSIVAAPHRDGGQAQYVPAPAATNEDTSLAPVRGWAVERLDQPLTLRDLARRAGMSQRSFMRHFTEETGMTPLQWLIEARIGAAREMLEATDRSIDEVARTCGLGTGANLRLHFRRVLDTTPTAYRRAFAR